MAALSDDRAYALRSLIPPPRLNLADWIEQNLVLPEGTSALPGRVRLWPFQRAIASAISDPMIERLTLIKGVRLGFTTLLTGAIGAYVANEPAAILALLPTDGDCRDYVVSELEPIFAATPALRGALATGTDEGDRNTLTSKRFAGGSLRVIAARAPRNLRRVTARILLIDEADAMDVTAEGNPIRLAERRTLSYSNRKIVVGSTPLAEDTSHVLRAYGESDARIFEVPCPECGGMTEIMWGHIEWQADRPETAAFRCPHCAALIAERHKGAMVTAGEWRATRPDVHGHAGFRLECAGVAVDRMLRGRSWPQSFSPRRRTPAELQVFTNTILAQGWNAPGAELDETALQPRAEDFGLNNIPPEVLVVTTGSGSAGGPDRDHHYRLDPCRRGAGPRSRRHLGRAGIRRDHVARTRRVAAYQMAPSAWRGTAGRRRDRRQQRVHRRRLCVLLPAYGASHLGRQGHGGIAGGVADGEGQGEVGGAWGSAVSGRRRHAEANHFPAAPAWTLDQVLQVVGAGVLRAIGRRAARGAVCAW